MPDRYYHKILKNEVFDPVLPDSDIVVLPPENVFWTPLPEGEKFTYDIDGLPDGTEPVVYSLEIQLREAAQVAGLTRARITSALLSDAAGNSVPLSDIAAIVTTLAGDFSVTEQEVRDALYQ